MEDVKNFKFYYLSSSKDSKFRYIGITSSDLETRLKFHLSEAKQINKLSHKNNWIRKEIKEGNNILINIISEKTCTKEQALLIEEQLISSFRDLCNLTNSVKINQINNVIPKIRTKAVVVLSKEGEYITRFNSLKECANYFNVNNSVITNILKGRKKSVRDFLLVYEKNYDPNHNYRYERKQVISPFSKKHPLYENIKKVNRKAISKKVIRIDLNTGEEIIFNSYSEACANLGKPRNHYANIVKVCKGERKKAFGYGWRFYEDIVHT